MTGGNTDFFFNDPNVVRLPPEEVRLREVQITPDANSGRVKIHLKLTPFQKRPDICVTITSASGKEAARTTILETMLTKLEITMHLREPNPGSEYAVETIVYYQKLPQPGEAEGEIQLPDPMIVDRQKTVFILA
jgi:hypothetical protein